MLDSTFFILYGKIEIHIPTTLVDDGPKGEEEISQEEQRDWPTWLVSILHKSFIQSVYGANKQRISLTKSKRY